MKQLILILLIAMPMCSIAQYIDKSAVITTSDVQYRDVFSKKVSGKIPPGETIYLKNIRIKPYFLIEYQNKQVLVIAHDLDSATYITAAIFYMNEQIENYNKYVKKYGKKYGLDVATGSIELGMTEKMVLDAKGDPDKINTSHYSFGTLEQWVYSDLKEYYYFKNGKLTSWQD